jgi:PIN domain nuclease of toxin-antitoxin system
VRLLLDTRAFLWWWLDDPTLHRDADEAVASADVVYVSLASAWEMAIKQGIGRLDLGEQAEKAILDSGFDPLPIHFSHVEAVARLSPHHKDPFDRMLIAQAQVEQLAIVTRDRHFEAYGVRLIRA